MSLPPSVRFPRCALAAGLLILLAVPASRADLLPIEFDPRGPDIFGFDGTLSYDASTGKFHADTLALTYTSDSTPAPGGFAFFDGDAHVTIDLKVDSSGNFVANGSGVVVTGGLDLDGDGVDDVTGDATTPLLYGSITAFGADPAGPPTRAFNGLFTIQGGLLTQNVTLSGGGSMPGGFPIGGLPGGFILFAESQTTGTLGDFTSNFSSDSVKSDVNPTVPEPATALLGLIGAGTLALGSWLRQRGSEGKC